MSPILKMSMPSNISGGKLSIPAVECEFKLGASNINAENTKASKNNRGEMMMMVIKDAFVD